MLFIIVAIVILFIITIAGGLSPSRISMTSKGDYFIKMGNIFSGGVFLGGGLLHLMPEGHELLGEVAPDAEYPYAFLLASVGFGAVLLIEKVLMRGEDVGRLSRALTAADLASIVDEIDSGGSGDRAPSRNLPSGSDLKGIQATYPYVLTLILSLHSVLAGIVLGLEEEAAAALAVLIAMVAHKFFEAFALGISMKEGGFTDEYSRSLIIFYSLMTPLGIILGLIFGSALEGDTSLWVQAVAISLAAGTFLYIAVLEIIGEAFEKGGQYRQQFFFMALGFILMAVLGIWG
jgi:zinc transporter 1/2/3